MTYDNDSPTPLYVTEGNRLTPITVNGTKYSFEHISFENVPIQNYPENLKLSNDSDLAKFFPDNSDRVLCFQPIGNLIESFSGVTVDMESLDQKNCGWVTPSGSIMPQIIYPYEFGRNELSFSDSNNSSKWNTADKNNRFHWKAVTQTTTSKDSEALKSAVKVLRHYGKVVDLQLPKDKSHAASIISILGKHPLMDSKEFSRSYISNLPSTSAFALLLDFVAWEDYEAGETKTTTLTGTKTKKVTTKKSPEAVFKILNDTSSKVKNADSIELRARPNGEIRLTVNGNAVEGVLNFSDLGLKPLHSEANFLTNKNVILFYPLLNSLVVTGDFSTNPKQGSKNLITQKTRDLDLLSLSDPQLNEFPSKHKRNSKKYIKLDSPKAYIQFGNRIQADWSNCYGNFALVALRFCPIVCFSYFYKLSGEQTGTNQPDGRMQDYFCMEIGGTNFNYKGYTSEFKSKKIYYNKKTQTSVFRVDITLSTTGNSTVPSRPIQNATLQSNPFELLGIIHVTKRTGQITDVLNGDGNFQTDFNQNVNFQKYRNYNNKNTCEKTNWLDFATQIQINHGLDGTSGSITLDKFMMMDQNKKPDQVIGALTLVAHNGHYSGTNKFTVNSSYSSLPDGQIFKGYGMEIQDSSDTLAVRLVGIQKKLSDMKLVNCPFWDGDRVFSGGSDAVLTYMKSYSGCDLQYVSNFSSGAGNVDNIILPRSWNWESPSTNFVLGTPVLDALREIAKKINHQFIIQPDGRGYFYYMNEYGYPTWVDNGSNVAKVINESDIISFDITPYLENRYNTFLTLGLLVKKESDTQKLMPDGVKPGMLLSRTSIQKGDYPWSRIITNSESGNVTIEDLEKFHKTNVRFGSSQIFSGSVTIPGWHGFFLFDRLNIVCDNGSMSNGNYSTLNFYITGITHNLNFQTKEWTTSLNIAQISV